MSSAQRSLTPIGWFPSPIGRRWAPTSGPPGGPLLGLFNALAHLPSTRNQPNWLSCQACAQLALPSLTRTSPTGSATRPAPNWHCLLKPNWLALLFPLHRESLLMGVRQHTLTALLTRSGGGPPQLGACPATPPVCLPNTTGSTCPVLPQQLPHPKVLPARLVS